MNYFTHKLQQLEQVVATLEGDVFALDELLNTDFEANLHVATGEIVFAVLEVDEGAGLFWTLQEVSATVEEVTDSVFVATVEEIRILLFDAKTHVFFFARTNRATEADELIESLL